MSIIQQPKQDRLEQRVSSAQRALIERGAQAKGKTLSEFVIESACLSAELAIMDQRMFFLDDEEYDAFVTRLDAPAQNNPGLERLFAKRAPWLA